MQHPPTASVTRDLGRFAAQPGALPQAALDMARTGIVDAIGLMLAAREEAVVRGARTVAAMGAPRGKASILLGEGRTRASDAAFVNAVAVHAFAMDDVAWGCHPSAMLLPALLATCEEHGASGTDLLRAWVVGYEVLAELAAREPDSLHPTGWHPTGLLGPVATTAAVCHLRRLSPEQTSAALGIAASMTGGVSVNFGTGTKAIHLGRVAQAAVVATELAVQGVDAAPDALERPGGLLRTISPSRRADITRPVSIDATALRLLSTGISIKKYPLCYSVHRIADAGIAISRMPGFRVARVARIEVAIGRRQAQMARHLQPGTSLEARYSVPFAVASGLQASSAGFAQLAPAFFDSAAVRRLIAATDVRLLDGANPDDPVFAPSDRVRVTLDDGTVLDSGEVAYERGHARLPIGAAQLREKFVDCARAGGVRDAGRLYDRLQGLEALASLAQLPAWVEECTPSA